MEEIVTVAINIQRCNARVTLIKLRKFTCSLAEDTLLKEMCNAVCTNFRNVSVFIEDLNNLSVCLSEPRHHYTNTDNRPDITIFDIETGQTLDLDISLAHPWSVDNVKRASRIDGFAASAREDKKKTKYSEHQLPGVVSPNVSLLCSNILVVGVRKLLGSLTNSLGRTRMWCSLRVTGENDFQ